MSIQVRHVTKRFSATPVLDDVSVDIASGELVALLGPSGCGKTTLLRIIAGLEQPDAGAILFSGEDTTDLDVRRRGVGFVFQHYALFRHMTVADNVAFGLRVKPRGERPSDAQIRRKVKDLLALVQLEGLADRYPSQLSGGQRQRIALARALAVEPKVLLLDEPFGALDAKVRKELRRWLRRLHDELHVASVFVTHDQEEALEVADRVVVMHAGRIEQVGTPDELWQRPATPFVQGFLGDVNLFHGRADGGVLDLGGVRLDTPEHGQARDAAALAYVRPHELDVARPGELPGGGLRVRLSRVVQAGALARLHLDREGSEQPLEADVPAELVAARAWRAGETLEVRPRQARVFLQP